MRRLILQRYTGRDFAAKMAPYDSVAAAIQQDIQRMLDYGVESSSQSRQRTPEPNITGTSPESMVSADALKNKMSRYNAFVAANIRDEDSNSVIASPPVDWSRTGVDEGSSTQHGPTPPQETIAGLSTGQQLPEQINWSDSTAHNYDISDSSAHYSEQPSMIRDWYWDMGLADGQDFDLNAVFDPLCRLQNQWEMGGQHPQGQDR